MITFSERVTEKKGSTIVLERSSNEFNNLKLQYINNINMSVT